MKDQITRVLGTSRKIPIEFDNLPNSNVNGLYTYLGDVFVLKDGDDIDFNDLPGNEQEVILNAVLSGKWKSNKSLQ